MSESEAESDAAAPRVFATTHWSVVLAAGQSDSPPAQRALETLCRGYWYPIYVYVRRKGHGPDEAKDLNTTNWMPAPQTVGENGTSKFIIVNPPAGNRFYRLFKP